MVAEPRRVVEPGGAQLAQGNLDERGTRLVSAASYNAILALAVKHLSVGASAGDVAHWLEAESELMQRADTLARHRVLSPTPTAPPHHAPLQFTSERRGSTVRCSDDHTTRRHVVGVCKDDRARRRGVPVGSGERARTASDASARSVS